MGVFQIDVEIVGCIWRGGDRVVFSARHNGEIIYCSIDALEQAIVEDARKRGITTGDMCDIINQQISDAEREQMRRSGMFYGEITFELTAQQALAWEAIFAPSPADPAQPEGE